MDEYVYGVDVVSPIFRFAFAHFWLHGVEAISYNSRSYLVFMQGKVNCARSISQVVNLVLLQFLRQ